MPGSLRAWALASGEAAIDPASARPDPGAGVFKDRNEPAVFEVSLPADPRQELEVIVLEAARAEYQRPVTRFHLMAVTGIEQR